MKIYTKTGDKGTTSLIGGTRVKKHHIRIDSYGHIDELNSWLGLIRDQNIDGNHLKILKTIQKELFVVGAQLALDPNKKSKNSFQIPEFTGSSTQLLESQIDQMNELLPAMTHFVLPGGHPIVSYCHLARTVCRRAERACTLLNEDEPVAENILVFLNRLSDYLFVFARKLSQDLEVEEVKWIP
ncbi:cob(I)yrinic acid a,c-diamide adenosyltransferase [Euzebyella saccharophila]|uniref:Corrinoid adenosyltransferase n=1 Tax=Euzebyella saccharophila TaxID=679664 RepID=A0ABV8JMR0_9FLAO|nr:cob(I)yrinic acid a,c-diamide adenosyltransferase [Euzebyella saccharophila]